MRLLNALVGALSMRIIRSENVVGSVNVPPHGTAFLTKFCMDYWPSKDKTVGEFEVDISVNMTRWPAGVWLVTLDDQEESYPDINEDKWGGWTCNEKLEHARSKWSLGAASESKYHTGIAIVEGLRPRYWYLAIVDCSGVPLALDFDIRQRNPLQGWKQELSMDQRFEPHVLLLFALIHLAILVLNRPNASDARWASHPMTRMLNAAVYTSAAAMVGLLISYVALLHRGHHIGFLYFVSRGLSWTSKLCLMSIMMLLAKGRGVSWTMDRSDLWWLGQMLVPLVAACYVLEMWGEYSESRKYTSGFIYDTYFGFSLIVIDVALFCLFASKLQRTHMMEGDPIKRMFYKILGIMGVAWFGTLPFIGSLGLVIAPHARHQILLCVTRTSHALATLILVTFFLQSGGSHVDIAGSAEAGIEAEVLGQGMLKLSSGPLPEESEEITGSKLQLLQQN
jgi:hypothetical protein